MLKNFFREKIIQWYSDNKRLLPWRATDDPYKIWISEIILQQTRVAQGVPYYLKFVERFSTVDKLASASEEEVLRLWQGLGYYTRARNLHRCAKLLMEQYGGSFPGNFDELKKLPGIGDYTAAAVSSIAFNLPIAVVDGNVYRVLARFFGIDFDIGRPVAKKYFFDLGNQLMSNAPPGEYNQAVMEFGAIQCVPQNPKCGMCPLKDHCKAFEGNLQNLLPFKTKKNKVRKRYLYYLVISQGQKLVLKKRTGSDIWKGLYDFYCIELSKPRKAQVVIEANKWLTNLAGVTEIGEPSELYRHVLSHQVLFARFIPVRLKSGKKSPPPYGPEKLKFYSVKQISDLPKPILVSKHLNDIGFL